MVKPEHTYSDNSNNLYVIYTRMREGNSYFTTYYKNKSQLVTTVQEIKKILGPAKFLQSSKDLYEWMDNLINESTKPKESGNTGIMQ